jgi:hypothetical protein
MAKAMFPTICGHWTFGKKMKFRKGLREKDLARFSFAAMAGSFVVIFPLCDFRMREASLSRIDRTSFWWALVGWGATI